MKISPKALLIIIYIVITFIATATLQTNPRFLEAIQEFTEYVQSHGVTGMLLYTLVSATFMALAIPLQFIDLILGMIYPLKEAIFILIASKMLGATFSFYIANYLLSEESKQAYTSSQYLKGLHELVQKEPLKYGLLIRFSSIPIIVRNYGLAILPISYHTYLACVFIQSSVTSPFQAYTGSHFHSFMEFAKSSTPQLDENGNIIQNESDFDDTKKTGIYVLLGGIACSLFVAYKIKKKVEEINKAHEEKQKSQ